MFDENLLKRVARMLDAMGNVAVVPGWEDSGDKIPFGVRTSGLEHIPVVLAGDPPIMQMRTSMMAREPGTKHRAALLQAILDINYQYKVVKFAFDPKDGEIVAYLDLMVGEEGPTQRQLTRCVNLIKTVVRGGKRRLERIASTGVDPGMEEVDAPTAEQIIDVLERLKKLRDAAAGSGGGSEPENDPNGGTKKPATGLEGLANALSDDETFGKN